MSSVGTCSNHNHWVKSIESHYKEEITALNVIGWYVDLSNVSFFDLKTHSFVDEVKIGLLHVGGSVTSDVGKEWMVSNSANKCLQSVEETYCLLFNSRAKLENLKSVEIKVDNCFCWKLEGDSVVAALEIQVNVSEFVVSEKDVIFAEQTFFLGCCHDNIEGRFSSVFVVDLEIKTATGKGKVGCFC
jgi:hypothetical protein